MDGKGDLQLRLVMPLQELYKAGDDTLTYDLLNRRVALCKGQSLVRPHR